MSASAAMKAMGSSLSTAQLQILPAGLKTPCSAKRDFAPFVGMRRTAPAIVSSAKPVGAEAPRKAATISAWVTNGSITTNTQAPFLKNPAGLIDLVQTFVLDCDGVIWKGDKLIEGVGQTLDELRAKGKRLVFVTNNSTKSRKDYAKKFASLGLQVSPEEIFASSFAAAAYLKSINFPSSKTVYVIGEKGIQDELDAVGIKNFGGPEDADKSIELASGSYLKHDSGVGAVVVGFDRNINYYKIQYGSLCLRENSGCLFIATNTDAVTHLTDAQEWAGGGSMVGALRGSTRKEPQVVGKPSTFMLDYLSKKFGISKSEICIVGDRLDTDILFGQRGGTKTLLVLSGVTSLADLQSSDVQPDYYTDKLSDLRTSPTYAEDAPTPTALPKRVTTGRSLIRGRGRGRGLARPSVAQSYAPSSPAPSFFDSVTVPAAPVSESESYLSDEDTPLETRTPATARTVRPRGGIRGRGRSRSPTPRSVVRSVSPSPAEEEPLSFWDAEPVSVPTSSPSRPRTPSPVRRGLAGRGRGRSAAPRAASRSLTPSRVEPVSYEVVDEPTPVVVVRSKTPTVRARGGLRGRGRSRSPAPRSVSRSVEEEPLSLWESEPVSVQTPSPSRPRIPSPVRRGLAGRGRGRSVAPRGVSRSVTPSRAEPVSYDESVEEPTPVVVVRSKAPIARGRGGLRGRGRARTPTPRSVSRSEEEEPLPLWESEPVSVPTSSPSRPRTPSPVRRGLAGRGRGRSVAPRAVSRSVTPSRVEPVSYEVVDEPTPEVVVRSKTPIVRGRGGLRGRGRSRSPAPRSVSRSVEEEPVSLWESEPVSVPTPSPSRPRTPSPVRRGLAGRGRGRSAAPRAASRSLTPSRVEPVSYDENVDEPTPEVVVRSKTPIVRGRGGLRGRGRSRSPAPRSVSRSVEAEPLSFWESEPVSVPTLAPSRSRTPSPVRRGLAGRGRGRSVAPRAASRSLTPSRAEPVIYDVEEPTPVVVARSKSPVVRGRGGPRGRGRSRTPTPPRSVSRSVEEEPLSFWEVEPVPVPTSTPSPTRGGSASEKSVRGGLRGRGRGRASAARAARSVSAPPLSESPEPVEYTSYYEAPVYSPPRQEIRTPPPTSNARGKTVRGRGRSVRLFRVSSTANVLVANRSGGGGPSVVLRSSRSPSPRRSPVTIRK